MLSETQLLLLNNLIYLSDFKPTGEECTVQDILDNITIADDISETKMNKAEWDEIMEMAKSDPDICNLKVTNFNKEKSTGSKMACFVDDSGQAYAVFKGTGANEWGDDFEGGYQADTEQQLKAKEWVDGLPYDDIIVSGHSKGGNKAMYVAITSDKVSKCVAFDGEGFSNEFLEKYSDEISQNASKIHLVANKYDYVNCILKYIPGIKIDYVDSSASITTGLMGNTEFHCPNALFAYKDGEIQYELGEFTDELGTFEQFIHGFTSYVLDNASYADKVLIMNVLGVIAEMGLGGENADVNTTIIGLFGVEAVEKVILYLNDYLSEVKITDPQKYKEYACMLNENGDFFGNIASVLGIGLFDLTIFSSSIKIKKKNILDNIVSNITGIEYGTVRDFSSETVDILLNAAEEVENEPWYDVSKWDCWYRVESVFGGLNIDSYTGKVDEYYKKIIDINGASVDDIKKIVEAVKEVDSSYGSKISSKNEKLSNIHSALKGVSNRINPAS